MDYLFNVIFSEGSKGIYFLSNYEVKQGEYVIGETPRGLELGKVVSAPSEYEVKEGEEIPYSYILRIADDNDIIVDQTNKKAQKNIINEVQQEANKLHLAMKVTSAEYTFDRTKLSISYVSEERVDFRDLLKILASNYHCRIDLRQIGPRDKAKIVGGIGVCGLPLCCSTFLNEFDGISITMAKNQMLALNIPKLSGHCGKLICCLKYEDETYTLEKQSLPRVGLRCKIDDTIYKIASINIITKVVRLESPDNILNLPLSQIEDKIIQNYNPNTPQAYNQTNVLKNHGGFNSRFKKPNLDSSVNEEKVTVEEKPAENINQEVEETSQKDTTPRENRNSNRFNNRNNHYHNQRQNNEPKEKEETVAQPSFNEDNEFNLIASRLYQGNDDTQNNSESAPRPRNNNYHHRYHNNNHRNNRNNNSGNNNAAN